MVAPRKYPWKTLKLYPFGKRGTVGVLTKFEFIGDDPVGNCELWIARATVCTERTHRPGRWNCPGISLVSVVMWINNGSGGFILNALCGRVSWIEWMAVRPGQGMLLCAGKLFADGKIEATTSKLWILSDLPRFARHTGTTWVDFVGSLQCTYSFSRDETRVDELSSGSFSTSNTFLAITRRHNLHPVELYWNS